MAGEKDSSLRFVSGDGQPVSCTVLCSGNDPEYKGRLMCYPDQWDPSNVPVENGLLCHTVGYQDQNAWSGASRHANILAGTRGYIHYNKDGTPHFSSTIAMDDGGDAPPGSAQAKKGKNMYAASCPKKSTT